MARRLQNRVSESRLTLPVMTVYAILVWLAGGLIVSQLWVQFACFALSTYLIVELNNSNALIRVYSRMVSCAFLALSGAACFLFNSIGGNAIGLCVIAAYTMLFRSYQDRNSPGKTFYAFACIGLASVFNIHILYFVPVIWLMMAFFIMSASWRTMCASVLGLCVPYWFAGAYLIYTDNLRQLSGHFVPLAQLGSPFDYTHLSPGTAVTLAFMTVIGLAGMTHYVRQSHNDKIRTRMFYNCFITMELVSIVFFMVQPQHSDMLTRMMVINTSPLAAHFLALTHTRLTNIAFCAIVAATIILTACNLWMPYMTF